MSCFVQSIEDQEVKVSYKANQSETLIIPNKSIVVTNDFKVDSKTGVVTYLGSSHPKHFIFQLSLFYPSSHTINGEVSHHLKIGNVTTCSLTKTLNPNNQTVSGFLVIALQKNDKIKIEGVTQANFACTYKDIKFVISPF